jgi:hypothetical protein
VLATCLVILSACGGVQQVGSLPNDEARAAVRLAAADREHLRRGMRGYLASVQGIVDALSESKLAAVSGNAKKAGMELLSGVPASVAVGLPPEFLMLSMDTHQKFDALSRLAAEGRSRTEVLTQMRDILANCTACHGKYRLAPE